MTTEDWSLTEAQRADTIARIRANVSAMAFFRAAPLAPELVETVATAVEKKAYTVARVEARTTTGMRPHHETLKACSRTQTHKRHEVAPSLITRPHPYPHPHRNIVQAYVRKLSELVLEVVVSGGQVDGVTPSGPPTDTDTDGTVLDLPGSREFLTTDTAEELLAPMLAPGSKIQKIKFSTKSFGVDAADVASKAIRNVSSTLIDADMSDIIAGRPEDEALAALRIISEALSTAPLRHLNLSDNALGEKGIRACAAAFQNQESLESIAFQNVGCSVHGCAAVNELLQKTGSLRRLHLLNNMSGDEGAASIAKILARCPNMEDFKMASSRVGAEGGVALANALSSGGTALISLDIHDNPMTSEVAEDLSALIAKHPSMKRLNLNDTCLGDEGVATVAAALVSAAPVLENLELELNEITVEGAEALSTALTQKTALKKLNLRENELEDDGALAVARGIAPLTSLQVIDLCTNQIKRGGACAVAKAVGNKKNLTLLGLDDNEISENGIDALKAILESSGQIGALGSLEENMPDEDDEEEEGGEGDEGDAAAVDALANELQKEHL